MKFIPRIMTQTIHRAMKTFPAVVLTGPRQSGKTTLFKELFSDTHRFVSLENPDVRLRAKADPVGFLTQYAAPVIIDEIQYLPELLSYIKTKIDENREPGQWLLTGSQNFVLMQNVTQSLAGRAAILSLLPFSLSENINRKKESQNTASLLRMIHSRQFPSENNRNASGNDISLMNQLLRGFYPEIAVNNQVDRQLWCGSYITTYLERDIRNLSHVGDLNLFERFLRLCATRTGQILNISEMARDVGISVPTAKRWLSLLETGNQVYLLYPYYKNIGKRLVKSPKLFFTDTGLCTYLLGISDEQMLLNGPSLGNIFETMVICDFLKRFYNHGVMPSMYYIRTRDGLEIDLVIEQEGCLHLFEIKSTMTITPKHVENMKQISRELKNQVQTASVISRAKENGFIQQHIMNYYWKDLLCL